MKLVTRYPGRTPALSADILLYDLERGELLALVDADWITAMRTGAVAAHAISLLAKPGFKRVAFMGLGNTARATLLCLLDIMSNAELEVGVLRYKGQHESFEARFAGFPVAGFAEFSDVAEMAGWCDALVSCVTVADGDFCDPGCFKPGALVVPVHTRGFVGCDGAFDKVFCDDVQHVSGFSSYDRFKGKLAEVADVVSGAHPGRERDDERILAYNVGIGLHDVFFAANIERLVSSKGGLTLEFAKPSAKYWV